MSSYVTKSDLILSGILIVIIIGSIFDMIGVGVDLAMLSFMNIKIFPKGFQVI